MATSHESFEKTPYFQGKRVLVMGLGLHGGGAGTVEFLAACRAQITVTDLRTRRQLAPTLRALKHLKGIHYVFGEHRITDFRTADLIVKNPGVRPDSPFLREARRAGIPITSDIGIFFRLCPARIIGVTGTRGKSTTTYLIWKFLKTKFRRVHYGGNIRKSALLLLPRIKKNDLVALELSSFQLQDLAHEKISPHIAVFTNLLRDHLNWHRDMREYAAAKSVIFRFQKSGDHLFINGEDAGLRRLAAHAPSRLHAVTAAALDRQQHSNILQNVGMLEIVDKNLGMHYRSSVALAVAVARHFGVPKAAIAETLRGFRGLPARQELIAMIRGVRFINDTTATIPDAAIAAIRRFAAEIARATSAKPHQGRVTRSQRQATSGAGKLILIAGGQDKKLDFRAMAREIKKNVDALILLPGTATDILMTTSLIRANKGCSWDGRMMRNKKRRVRDHALGIKSVSSMAEAVQTAYGMAEKGDYIVLSPGATSFGSFLNEFDRGDQFAASVKILKRMSLRVKRSNPTRRSS